MSPGASKIYHQRRQDLVEEEPDWGDAHEDFDLIYRQCEEASFGGEVPQQHENVFTHLVSQVCHCFQSCCYRILNSECFRSTLEWISPR